MPRAECRAWPSAATASAWRGAGATRRSRARASVLGAVEGRRAVARGGTGCGERGAKLFGALEGRQEWRRHGGVADMDGLLSPLRGLGFLPPGDQGLAPLATNRRPARAKTG